MGFDGIGGMRIVPTYWTDVDGDGILELVETCWWQGTPWLLVRKYGYGQPWMLAADRQGEYMAPASSSMVVHAVRPMMLYPISVMTAKGTKWGYMNDRGAMFIRPQYDYAYDFQSNGLAVIQLKDRSGLIHLSGQVVVPPVYQSINEFSEGRAAVTDEEGFRVIDEAGNILTPKAYSYIGTYREGRVLFTETDLQGNYTYGYLDRQGKEVIPAQYDYGSSFADGKALVKVKDNEYALIGLDGKRLATYPYDYVGPPSEGLLAFKKQSDGKYGFIDERGNVVIPPQYTGAQPVRDGRVVVNTAKDYGNKYGLIDRTGKFILPPTYNSIELLREQRAAIGEAIDPEQPVAGSKFALADSTNGKFLSDFKYYGMSEYKNGLASVYDSKETFFIDRNGKVVPYSPKISGSGTLQWIHSLISAHVDLRLSYYDRWGKLLWKPNTTIALSAPYRVKEEKCKPNKDYLVYYPQIEGMADKKTQQHVNLKLKELSQVKPVQEHVQLDHSYTGDFQISFYRDNLLVLELNGYDYPFGAAHGMPTEVYVHIDLKNGDMYELKNLFKPDTDYVKVLSDLISQKIKNDPQYSYVFPDSYKGIQPDQPFYVTDEALYVYFTPYEIAPYAAGFPTFMIPYREIDSILNKDGAFWRSYH